MPTLTDPKQFPPLDPTALRIIQRLRAAGHEAYLCGGCVRDLLRGTVPGDWDVTTGATPDEIDALFPHTLDVGRSFGVMLVLEDGKQTEVATFRTDSPDGDGRRPAQVIFATAEEDVKRRDFTINGLLFDPTENRVIDHVDGVADLEAGVVRTIGSPEQRFREDYLRLLRAVRFSANLSFSLAPQTLQAIQEMAGLVKLVSAERQGEELTKMLIRGHAGEGIRLLFTSHLVNHLLPELLPMQGMPQPVVFHPEGDVLIHTCMMLDDLPEHPEPALAWAALLHDVGKPDTLTITDRIRFNHHPERGVEIATAILRRLKRSNQLIDQITSLIGQHMRFTHLHEMRTAKRRRWLRQSDFPLHLELHRLDCVASHGKMDLYKKAREARVEEEKIPEPEAPLLTGRHLIKQGYTPGPTFSTILGAVEDARLEGTVSTEEEACAWVRSRYALPSPRKRSPVGQDQG
ncbi:MAG: CCA tRNA nucleotidyltransferase [Planctomycetota bacterium]